MEFILNSSEVCSLSDIEKIFSKKVTLNRTNFASFEQLFEELDFYLYDYDCEILDIKIYKWHDASKEFLEFIDFLNFFSKNSENSARIKVS